MKVVISQELLLVKAWVGELILVNLFNNNVNLFLRGRRIIIIKV